VGTILKENEAPLGHEERGEWRESILSSSDSGSGRAPNENGFIVI